MEQAIVAATALAFSPWVMTRDCLWRPAVIAAGKMATSCGGIDVEVAGPDEGNYGGFWSQRRTGEHESFRRSPFDWPPVPRPPIGSSHG